MSDAIKTNKKLWESNYWVTAYSQHAVDLQKPEQAIYDLVQKRLPQMRVLDIGIGTGRTTAFFCKTAKEYIGVDYSEAMIDYCKAQNFKGNNIAFQVVDACRMDTFEDGYFDLVLFSYNGLDCINHQNRLLALKEMKRVLKDNGLLVFSSHNINAISELAFLKQPLSWNLYRTGVNLLKRVLFSLINPSLKSLQQKDWAIIKDAASWFKMDMYYINPVFQIKQLKKLGLNNIQPFSVASGDKLSLKSLSNQKDSWIYYVAQKSQKNALLLNNTEPNTKSILNNH